MNDNEMLRRITKVIEEALRYNDEPEFGLEIAGPPVHFKDEGRLTSWSGETVNNLCVNVQVGTSGFDESPNETREIVMGDHLCTLDDKEKKEMKALLERIFRIDD